MLVALTTVPPPRGQPGGGVCWQKIHPHTPTLLCIPTPADDSLSLSAVADAEGKLFPWGRSVELSESQFLGANCEEGNSVSGLENRTMTRVRGQGWGKLPPGHLCPMTLPKPERPNHVQHCHGPRLRNGATSIGFLSKAWQRVQSGRSELRLESDTECGASRSPTPATPVLLPRQNSRPRTWPHHSNLRPRPLHL